MPPLEPQVTVASLFVKTKSEDEIYKVSKRGSEGRVATKNYDGEGGIKYFSPDTEVRFISEGPGFSMPKDMVQHLTDANVLMGNGPQEMGKKWVSTNYFYNILI